MPFKRKGKCVFKITKSGKQGKKKGCSKSVAKAKKYVKALYANSDDIVAEEIGGDGAKMYPGKPMPPRSFDKSEFERNRERSHFRRALGLPRDRGEPGTLTRAVNNLADMWNNTLGHLSVKIPGPGAENYNHKDFLKDVAYTVAGWKAADKLIDGTKIMANYIKKSSLNRDAASRLDLTEEQINRTLGILILKAKDFGEMVSKPLLASITVLATKQATQESVEQAFVKLEEEVAAIVGAKMQESNNYDDIMAEIRDYFRNQSDEDYLEFDDHPLSTPDALMDPNKPAPWDHLINDEDDEDIDIDVEER